MLGVLAIGLSGHDHLQSMANKINPVFSVVFTVILYLSIGPFFAIPRTATVSYEIGITPFFGSSPVVLLIYSIIFFVIVGWLSLNPAKIVDRVGKLMTPVLLIFLINFINCYIY